MRRWFDRFLIAFAVVAASLAFTAHVRQWQRSAPVPDAIIVEVGPRWRCGHKTHCTDIKVRAQGQTRTGRFEEGIFVARPSVGMRLPLRVSYEDGVDVFRTGTWSQAFLAWLLLGVGAVVAITTMLAKRRRAARFAGPLGGP